MARPSDADRRTLTPSDEAHAEATAAGVSHATPGTAVDVAHGLGFTPTLNQVQRDFDIIDITNTATVPGAFAFSAVDDTNFSVVCSVASRAFEVIPR